MLDEVGQWLTRLVKLLPQILGLWEAVKSPTSPRDELDAQLALVRAMKDMQMREALYRIEDSEPPPGGP